MIRFLMAFARLTRFEHAVMLAIAVLIGEIITAGTVPALTTVIAFSLLVPIFSEMGSFALNDYLDIESDRINKRKDRPLVSGELSRGFALWFAVLSIAVSIGLAYFINIYAFAIALVFNALAIAYNYKLKDLPLIGNMYIGLSMAIPFAFGNVVVTNSLNLNPTIIVLLAMAFVAGLAREIVKSVQDMEGDRKARSARTLPIVIGEKKARVIASLLYVVFVPIAFAPFFLGLKQATVPLALVGIADIGILYIAYSVFAKGDEKTLKTARNLSLVCLFLGLIGLLLAAVY